VVSPCAYNAVQFVSDFIARLNQLQRLLGSRPAYPTEPWHRALREADSADTRRSLAARYAELDVGQQRVRYCERLYGSSLPRMNGRPLRLVSVEPEIPETRGRKMTLQQ
jgi:hypothetical protein